MSQIFPPLDHYEACQYVVRNPATWNPAATSAADLDGCTTLAIGERILCPSGTNVGIWKATSATVAVADSGFSVREGLTVRCFRSAGAPTYRQTATSGTAAFVDITALRIAVSDGSGASKNDVVRLTLSGVPVSAQADTTAHSASLVGVYDGSSIIPFYAQPIVKFDSAPVVGRPCYLSASIAGAMTSVTPLNGNISVPTDITVLQDLSVDTLYRALVGVSSAMVSSLSVEQQFVADTATRLGVIPTTIRYKFVDFDVLASTCYPSIGGITYSGSAGTHLALSPSQSAVGFHDSDGLYPLWVVTLGAPGSTVNPYLVNNSIGLCAQKWMLRFRWKTVGSGLGGAWLEHGLGKETIALTTDPSGNASYGCARHDYNPQVTAPSLEITYGSLVAGVWHVTEFSSIGDNTVTVATDGVTNTIACPTTGGTGSTRFIVSSSSLEFDYWGFSCSI